MPEPSQEDTSFKRKLSKREKKQLKKQEKLNKHKDKNKEQQEAGGEGVAEKLYTGESTSHIISSFQSAISCVKNWSLDPPLCLVYLRWIVKALVAA